MCRNESLAGKGNWQWKKSISLYYVDCVWVCCNNTLETPLVFLSLLSVRLSLHGYAYWLKSSIQWLRWVSREEVKSQFPKSFKKYPQSWTKVVETYGNYHHIFHSCEFSSLLSWKVVSPSPLFNVGNKQTSTKRFATLFGGRVLTIEEKGVFIQKNTIIVSLKAFNLVLLKCLNTFKVVHDCRYQGDYWCHRTLYWEANVSLRTEGSMEWS